MLRELHISGYRSLRDILLKLGIRGWMMRYGIGALCGLLLFLAGIGTNMLWYRAGTSDPIAGSGDQVREDGTKSPRADQNHLPRIEPEFVAEAGFQTVSRETYAFRVTNGCFFFWLEQENEETNVPDEQRAAVRAGKLGIAASGMRQSLAGLCESRGCTLRDIKAGRILLEKTLDDGKITWRLKPTYDFPGGFSASIQATYGQEISVPVRKDWLRQVLSVKTPFNIPASGGTILGIAYQGKDVNAKEQIATFNCRPLRSEDEE